MLPPYDTRATLARIETIIHRLAPARVIALGDSFHDPAAAERLDEEERGRLARLIANVEWIWIAGNHDPLPPKGLGGCLFEEVEIGGLAFRHEPREMNARGEVAGHLHPCATVTRRGRSLRRRCFASDGTRLLMPAFGAYAGGLDVRDRAVRTLFPGRFLAYLLGAARVYAVAG